MCNCWSLGIIVGSSHHLRILFGCCWSILVIMGFIVGMLLLLLAIRGGIAGDRRNWFNRDLDMEDNQTPDIRGSSKSDRKDRIKEGDGMISVILLIMAAIVAWNTDRWYSIVVIVYMFLVLLVACYRAGKQEGGKGNGKESE